MEDHAQFEAIKAAALKDITAYTDNIAKTKYTDLTDPNKRMMLISSYANANRSAGIFREFIQEELMKQLSKTR